MKIELPYGRESISCELPDERIAAVLTSRLHDYDPGLEGAELVRTS